MNLTLSVMHLHIDAINVPSAVAGEPLERKLEPFVEAAAGSALPQKVLADGTHVDATDPRADHVAIFFPSTGWMVAAVLIAGLVRGPLCGALVTSDHIRANPNALDEHNSDRAQFPCDKQACGSCVYHNLNASRPAFDNCGDGYAVHAQFDVEISDPFAWFLPQHYALPLLHDAYPASTWILNSRETPERWADSVLHWYSVTNRILNSFGHTYHEGAAASSTVGLEREVTVEALTRELDVSIRRANAYLAHERRRRLLVDLYVDHEQAVHDFAAQYGHPLLVLDVDSPSAGQVLQAFFAEKKLKPECWSFDGAALDNDWMDFLLQVPT